MSYSVSKVVSSILSTTDNVDLKTVATTNLYTVPAGKKVVITGIVIRPTSVSGLITVGTLGIGIASGEIDIIPATALTGLIGITKVFNQLVPGLYVIGNSGDVIKCGVSIGAVSTTFLVSIDLIGYTI